ncbi:MAG: glutathione transferase GstA [Magnetospirillum sp.]|nr:glutathione transferase GstA [Magnetospirillum sp.]
MKLYYKAGACSMASHLALEESGLIYAIEAVDLVSKKTESGIDFQSINPKGYIPALVLDDGAVLTEGVAILLRIAALAPDKELAPAMGSINYMSLVEWLVFIATELHKPAGMQFNPAMPADGKTALKTILTRRLDYAEKTLGTGPFLMGKSLSVADFYLFTVFSWLGRLGIDTGAWPHLIAHFERIKARPATQAVFLAEGLA